MYAIFRRCPTKFSGQRYFFKGGSETKNASSRPKKIIKYGAFALIAGSTAAYCSKYTTQEQQEQWAHLGGMVRFLRSLKTGMVISIDYYFSMMGLNEEDSNYKAMMSRIHQRAADRMLATCLSNGGLYIKLGQGLVSMSHILPKEYISTLVSLQDKCLTRSKDEVNRLFQQDFGKNPTDVFDSFDPEPIAAASLAQVFIAYIKDQKVAVKVQYIDLQRRFHSDIATINFLLTIVGFMHPSFNFNWVLKDLTETLKEELDFIHEGQNAERCAKDLSHLSFVYVPKIFWDKCSTRVLTAEYIDGIKINEIDKLKREGFSLRDINVKLFQAFGEQIFNSGFIHSDPHPGNLLIRWDKRKKAQLILLDHGLYQEITKSERLALANMWRAIVFNNHKDMEKYSLQLGVENYGMFAGILTQSPFLSNQFRLRVRLTEEDLKHMTEIARDRFDIVMKILQDMPRSLILVIRNLNTIRAIARSHGDPIDRYAALARLASKFCIEKNISMKQRILRVPEDVYFELKILTNQIATWLFKSFFKLLMFLGRSPDTSQFVNRI